MKNLSFNYGSNNGAIVNLIPFYIEVVQNNNVIATCHSTEGNISTGIFIKTIQFDDTISTTIRYYNLGKNSNVISCTLLNGNDFSNSSDSFSNVTDGKVKSTVLGNNNFPSYYLSIICKELFTTLSGVTYIVSGNSIISTKAGDNTFISSSTPNIALNSNYVQLSQNTAPVVDVTTIVSTAGNLRVSGMLQGDIFAIYVDDIKVTSETQNVITIASTNEIYIPVASYSGKFLSFSYFRGGEESLRSQVVEVTGSARLNTITITSVNDYSNLARYINEPLYISALHSNNSVLIVKKGNGDIAVSNIDYSINLLNQPTGVYGTITFLVAGNYQLQQSETNFITSISLVFNVGASVRPKTIKPILTILGKSISVSLPSVVNDNKVELWIKNEGTGIYSQLGLTIITTVNPYVFNNLIEGTYKVKNTEYDKIVSDFSNEQVIFLSPIIVGSNNRQLGDTIQIGNLNSGDTLEVSFSADNITFTTSNIIVNLINQGDKYNFTPTVIGFYKFKRIKGSYTSNFSSLLNLVNIAVSPPILSATSMQIDGSISISNITAGDILSYVKDGTDTVSLGVINATNYNFTIGAEGSYQFKLTRNNINSELTSSLIVISGTQCILSQLQFTQNIDNPSLYDVVINNPQNVAIKYVLRNSNNEVVLNEQLNTSPTNITNFVKGQIDFSNVVEDIDYQVLFLSNTIGKTCSLLSDRFNFNIVSGEPIDIVLGGNEDIDCKGMFLTQFTETIQSGGLEISFRANFDSAISNNPPFFVSIMKQDGTELFQDGTNILTSYLGGKLRCIIPFNNIPSKFTSLIIKATVSSNSNILSDVYSCIASSEYIIVSDIQSFGKSKSPILDAITVNSTTLSFISDCSEATGKFFVNNVEYTAEPVIANNYIVSTPIIESLKIGDVINATQTCPNKLESDKSGSITILTSCNKVSGGEIEGENNVIQNSVKVYKVTGLQGSSPFSFETLVSGGEILGGANTSEVTVKITSNTSCIIGFKIKNCNDNYSINLTKSIIVSQVQIGLLSPPRILGLNSNRLTGISNKNVLITVFNENNEIVANNIIANADGVWFVSRIKKQLAYYAIASFQNSKSNISNILVPDNVKQKKEFNCDNIIL